MAGWVSWNARMREPVAVSYAAQGAVAGAILVVLKMLLSQMVLLTNQVKQKKLQRVTSECMNENSYTI